MTDNTTIRPRKRQYLEFVAVSILSFALCFAIDRSIASFSYAFYLIPVFNLVSALIAFRD